MTEATLDKTELIQELGKVFNELKTKPQKEQREIEKQIKTGLAEKMILPGEIQEWINSEEKLSEIETDKLFFLSEQTYKVLPWKSIMPSKYFTEREIKEIKTMFEGYSSESIMFPYIFHNVIQVNDDEYLGKIKASEINKISHLLQYNPITQREMRQLKRGSQTIPVPKIIKKNVNAMVDLMKKGRLISTMLTFNARFGTADDGEEVYYNSDDFSLTVQKGTLLDVVDGFHRITAISKAIMEDSSLDMVFKITILNRDTPGAEDYFIQMNTFTPISTAHLESKKDTRQANIIARQVRDATHLKDTIAAGDSINKDSDLLITFITLSDAIDDVYQVTDRKNIASTTNYLIKFFNQLFYSFPNEFIDNISEVRKESIVNSNIMFYGYIMLSKKMLDNGVLLDRVEDIIKDIDFSRNNKLWEELKVLENGVRSGRPKKEIYKYFDNIDLEKYKEG